MIEIYPTRVGYECSAGDCGAMDCCRCHPEIEKIVVEPPVVDETITDGVY